MKELIIRGNITAEGANAHDASHLRYAFEDNIELAELGSVIGGGCELDSAVFDLQINTPNVDAVKELLASLLKQAGLENDVELQFTEQ